MNTKGMVELIVLNIGLDVGIINTTVFTIMVLMTLFTTFMTSPAVNFLYRDQIEQLQLAGEDSDLELAEHDNQLRVILCLNDNTIISPIMNFINIYHNAIGNEISIKVVRMKLRDDDSLVSVGSKSSLPDISDIIEDIPHIKNISLTTETDILSLINPHRDNIIIYPLQNLDNDDSHDKSILSSLFEAPIASIFIFHSPPSLESYSTSSKIFIPFFGGPNDREAVTMGLSLASTLPIVIGIYTSSSILDEDEAFLNSLKLRTSNPNNTTTILSRPYSEPEKAIETLEDDLASTDYQLVILGRTILDGFNENRLTSLVGTIASEILQPDSDITSHFLIVQKADRSPVYTISSQE